MKLLVCLKQVPDSTMRIRLAGDARGIDPSGITWAISPYDEYAIELALEHKDRDPGTTVGVVSVGPARAKDALRAALAMGCDEATFVTGEGAESLGGLAVARALAAVVREQQPDVALCGKQASDDDQGLVGPALADALDWPHVSVVTKFDVVDDGIEAWREVEGGHEIWRAPGKIVLTVQKSEKEPRYPSLPGIMKAKKKEIPEKAVASLLDAAERDLPSIEIVKLSPPPQRGGGRILKDGDAKAIASELVRLLREEAKVL